MKIIVFYINYYVQGMARSIEDKLETMYLLQAKRCVHFYACICAFASDPKLSEEFSYYINLDHHDFSIPKPPVSILQNNEQDKIVGIGNIYFLWKGTFLLQKISNFLL